jgi:hypothetical protein
VAYNTDIGLEDELREAILTGKLVDRRTGHREHDDPMRGAEWDARRTVAATLLADVLTLASNGARRPRALRLAGVRISGVLDLEAATLLCPLLLRDCFFEQPVNLAEAQAPAVRLPGCHIPALYAQQLETRGNLELNERFTAQGQVDLSGAHVGGTLNLIDAHLQANRDGSALFAEGLTVDGDMFCRGGFTANGEVDLMGAHVGGELSFSGSKLSNADGIALQAQAIEIGQDLKCRNDVTIEGMVSLLAAHIHGDLNLYQAHLANRDGPALFANGLTVDRNMDGSELTAQGQVDLSGAHVGGTLNLIDAHLQANRDGSALLLQQLQASVLLLQPQEPLDGLVDLTHARVGTLVDNEASWPQRLRVRGFVYDTLYEASTIRAAARLRWLKLDEEGYSPQPYEQLAAVYRRAGRDQDARTVALAKQRARRRALAKGHHGYRRLLARSRQAWSLLLDVLVGYGYRTWLAGLWLLGFVLAGWWIFDRAHLAHLLIAPKPPGERPLFNGGLYALDLLLPVGDLNYQDAWIARGWARGFWLTWILVGWVLTTAVLAAITGILKRD